MQSLSVRTMLETCRHMVLLLKTAMSRDHATVSRWFVSGYSLPAFERRMLKDTGLCCGPLHHSALSDGSDRQDHRSSTRIAADEFAGGRGSGH